MHIYYKEISLADGFAIAQLDKHSRIVGGREVSLCSGIQLFRSLENGPIRCYRCKCVADRWISEKGRNDKNGKPVLNLFALQHLPATKKRPASTRLVMMTRDHIIPKSKGGKDVVQNLRPACELCNNKRGSQMTKQELHFMITHPELIDPIRAAKYSGGVQTQPEITTVAQVERAVE